jgi:predicted metalloendopeptidase
MRYGVNNIVCSFFDRIDKIYAVFKDFLRVMTGQQQKSPRWKECTQGPTGWLPLAAGSLYIREHFDSTDKQEALGMIANLRESFSYLVTTSNWMDNATKLIAINKVRLYHFHLLKLTFFLGCKHDQSYWLSGFYQERYESR